MIRYTLRCTDGHGFESWFSSASAYDGLRARGLVTCPDCGTKGVDKAVMAPGIATSGARSKPAPSEQSGDTPFETRLAETPLAELRRKIEKTSDYVGRAFAREARAMHDGATPTRSIWGEARLDEAKRLVEDGVPIAPLPFVRKAKLN